MNCNEISFFIKLNRKPPLEQILGRSVEDLKVSPQGSSSPGAPSPNDRAAAKRAELRRQEQERRRREAVRNQFYQNFHINRSNKLIYYFSFLQMAGQIDMNMQSNLMAEFEESLERERR